MLLETSIMPRRDGTVIASVGDKKYQFRLDEQARMVAEVTDDSAIASLLATGYFMPANEEDFAVAAAFAAPQAEDEDEDEDDDDDDDGDPDAAPIEEPVSAVAAKIAKPRKPRVMRKHRG